ncbi:hypothetical protein B484DRAFT_433503 [Ochromonadaceae sp. CCMP2298]|nr:hypothetical protein B484DRAFT_433503 [Ochromonadaceae sp. CCMP2298]|mmetsp:Transcript_21422/g.47576  ORF Transcript_21422/g.47576 Transcript_21422/m.47576 type:complete len:452 (-) Transcript_21422:2356-3711(-)
MISTLKRCPCCPDTAPPEGYFVEPTPGLSDAEITWDEGKHLALAQPDVIKMLDKDMHNDPDMVQNELATAYGCSSAFRVLSDEGNRVLGKVLEGLDKHATSSPRIPKVLRGGTFRNKFLNGMGHSAAVLKQVSALAGCEMIYHPMKIQQLHINLKPKDDGGNKPKKNVDRWHCDTTPFVLVLFATSPDEYEGGMLQYFNGTREEGTAILKSGVALPEDRILNVGRQLQGYGVFMQGWRVFHQVTPVSRGDNRTTLVYSFQPRNVLSLEAAGHLRLTYNTVDPLSILATDWVRYRAWKTLTRLELLQENLGGLVSSPESDCFETKGEQKSSELSSALHSSSKKLCKIVETLPYKFERAVIAELLSDAIVEVREYLLTRACETYPPAEKATGKGGETHVAHVLTLTTAGQTESDEFDSSPFGRQNLQAAVTDMDSCIEDILTIKESETTMEYF